jgi:hypothetical protein
MIEHETDDIQPNPSIFKDYGTTTIYDWEHDTPSFDFEVDHRTQLMDDHELGRQGSWLLVFEEEVEEEIKNIYVVSCKAMQ